jgi:hypothetical protein
MPKPFLLAMTPRAGLMNHRYLVSSDAALDDQRAAEWIDKAIQAAGKDGTEAEGPSFLAVCKRGVMQVEGGRLGDEVLLLNIATRPRCTHL